MRLPRRPELRTALPWLVGVGLIASLACLAVALYLGFSTRTEAAGYAARQLAAQADVLARQVDGDMAQFDLTLQEAARLLRPGPSWRRIAEAAVTRFAIDGELHWVHKCR